VRSLQSWWAAFAFISSCCLGRVPVCIALPGSTLYLTWHVALPDALLQPHCFNHTVVSSCHVVAAFIPKRVQAPSSWPTLAWHVYMAAQTGSSRHRCVGAAATQMHCMAMVLRLKPPPHQQQPTKFVIQCWTTACSGAHRACQHAAVHAPPFSAPLTLETLVFALMWPSTCCCICVLPGVCAVVPRA
jgi:hypothetical protein